MAEISLSDVVSRLKQEGQLTRNSGTNSLKSIKEILKEDQKVKSSERLADKETAREQSVQNERQTEILSGLAQSFDGISNIGSVASSGGGGGGAGILGGLLGGAGMGGGALMAGLGILAGGGGYLLSQIGDMDAEGIKKNVLSLLSIGDAFTGGNWGFLLEGGAFGLAMAGIGAGLGVFAIGSAAASVATRFEAEGWTTKIKDNVKELLAIKDELGGNVALLYNGAAFGLAMTGIGTGLAVFGVGSAIAGAAEGLAQFTGGDDWATRIKNNVVTLLGIKDELGSNWELLKSSGAFALSMTGIAAGLAVFGAGSAVAGVGAGLADALAKFTGESDFANLIKTRVKTLMSIKDDLGGADAAFGETGTFLGIMTGIAAGLAVWGAGATVAGVGGGLADAIAKFTGNEADFAQKIKDQVKTLVSITDELSDGDGPTSKAGLFALGMAKVAAGLVAISAGEFVGTLGSIGTEILKFFGANSPFDQIMAIAEKSDQLVAGAGALEKIAAALSAFGQIRVSAIDLDFEKLALNLGRAVPFLDALANGGEVAGSGGWFNSPIVFPKGLLDPSLRLDELAAAAAQVNAIIGGTPLEVNADTATRMSQSIEAANNSVAVTEAAVQSAPAGGGGNTAVDASTQINQSSSTNLIMPTDMSARERDSNPYSDWGGYNGQYGYGG